MSTDVLDQQEVSQNRELLREKTLEQAKSHKASWIKLGQYLYSIYKDKVYKEWGYLSFDGYCGKELGIRQNTASKLLKSYYYLEKKEPMLAKEDESGERSPSELPNYESVNILRLAANNKKLTEEDVQEIRESVIERSSEPKEVRAQVKKILEVRDDRDPTEIRSQRRNSTIKRLSSMLNNAVNELGQDGLVPEYLLKQMKELVEKLNDQVE